MISRALLTLILALVAVDAFALSHADAVHILMRTGFDATPARIATLAPMTRDQAVRWIVDQAAAGVRTYSVAPPAWTRTTPDILPRPQLKNLTPQTAAVARKAYQHRLNDRAIQLKEWYIEEMIHSPTPFAERIVLFWHNNFTSSLNKVRDAGLLFNQDRLIRRYAFGNFGSMLRAIAHDPAMILYLDNETNRKGKPNENFAREVMELFTMGVGHYTETDVKQSARAFTGWRVDFRTDTFHFDRKAHDFGTKTFLGHTGNLNGDDILSIILAQKAVATFITEKLWREFVSPNPDPHTVARLADGFRQSGYQIKPLLIALLESQAFWAPANREQLVRSPVDLIVGTVRRLGLNEVNPLFLVRASRVLGQDLFNPRTVKGWPVGIEWINSETLIRRQQVLSYLVGSYARELRRRVLAPAYQLD